MGSFVSSKEFLRETWRIPNENENAGLNLSLGGCCDRPQPTPSFSQRPGSYLRSLAWSPHHWLPHKSWNDRWAGWLTPRFLEAAYLSHCTSLFRSEISPAPSRLLICGFGNSSVCTCFQWKSPFCLEELGLSECEVREARPFSSSGRCRGKNSNSPVGWLVHLSILAILSLCVLRLASLTHSSEFGHNGEVDLFVFTQGRAIPRASLVAQLVKNPLAMREMWVRSLGWEDPLEKGKATHSSTLDWRIQWIV